MTRASLLLAAAAVAAVIAAPASSQSLSGGARAAALGGGTTALAGESWSNANPASIVGTHGPAAALFVSRSFGLAELVLSEFSAGTALGSFFVAVAGASFGFEEFRTSELRLVLARAFRPGTSRIARFGATIQANHLYIRGYGSASTFAFHAGGILALSELLDAGFAATNLNAPSFAGVAPLERRLSVGLAFRPEPRLVVIADVVKEIRSDASLRGGIEIRALPGFFLRAGFTSQPATCTFGTALAVGAIAADIVMARHSELGWSQGASLQMSW